MTILLIFRRSSLLEQYEMTTSIQNILDSDNSSKFHDQGNIHSWVSWMPTLSLHSTYNHSLYKYIPGEKSWYGAPQFLKHMRLLWTDNLIFAVTNNRNDFINNIKRRTPVNVVKQSIILGWSKWVFQKSIFDFWRIFRSWPWILHWRVSREFPEI